jgi:hypothetical protein
MGFSRDHVKRTGIDAYEAFKKAGGTIYVPTPAEKALFVEAGKAPRSGSSINMGRNGWISWRKP